MAVAFKMKLLLVWICLITEVFSFPTQSPSDVDETKACCVQDPKLIYKGHDSDGAVNVYVFEFPSQTNEAKDKRVEDTTMKNDLQGKQNALKDAENGENHDDTIIATNKSASIYKRKIIPDTETSTKASTHKPDLKFDTINSTVSAAQNDIEMYEDTGLSKATQGHPTGMSDTREMQKTSGLSNGDDYYATEGSALLDIPSYSDTGNQDPKVDFPPNVKDFNNSLGCPESEGQCMHPPTSKEHTFVTQPTTTTRKEFNSKRRRYGSDGYANRERNTMNRKVKWSVKPKKTNKHKSEKKIEKKGIPIRNHNGKIFQHNSGQRRKIGGKRHNTRYYRSSSSESDSSQEFD